MYLAILSVLALATISGPMAHADGSSDEDSPPLYPCEAGSAAKDCDFTPLHKITYCIHRSGNTRKCAVRPARDGGIEHHKNECRLFKDRGPRVSANDFGPPGIYQFSKSKGQWKWDICPKAFVKATQASGCVLTVKAPKNSYLASASNPAILAKNKGVKFSMNGLFELLGRDNVQEEMEYSGDKPKALEALASNLQYDLAAPSKAVQWLQGLPLSLIRRERDGRSRKTTYVMVVNPRKFCMVRKDKDWVLASTLPESEAPSRETCCSAMSSDPQFAPEDPNVIPAAQFFTAFLNGKRWTAKVTKEDEKWEPTLKPGAPYPVTKASTNWIPAVSLAGQ